MVDRERHVREEEPPEERQRADHQGPSPTGRQDHRRERDVNEVEEAERIEGAASEIEHRRQQHDVEQHDSGEHAVLHIGAPPPRSQCQVADRTDRQHESERRQREADSHQAIDDQDGSELSGERAPAERQQPGEIDAV
jgi:hypothetical protein